MGANFESHVIHAKTEVEAVKAAESYQRQQQYERGHGPYTGHLGTAGIGVQRRNSASSFTTTEEAYEWANNYHTKWSLPFLLKVGIGDEWLLAGLCSS